MSAPDETSRDPMRLAQHFMESSFRIMQTVRAKMRDMEPSELSVPQFRLMIALRHEIDPSVADLADIMDLSRPAVSRLVDGLVVRELVSRVDSPEDRRRVDLKLTAAGRDLVDAVDRKLLTGLAEVFEQLPEHEFKIVSAGLQVLHETFARQDPPSDFPPGPPAFRPPGAPPPHRLPPPPGAPGPSSRKP